jgi:membrane protein implicated in regulation of membrane protease activity
MERIVSAAGWFWWVGAGALVVLELLIGTFYMLMVALGFIAGAIARLVGAPPGVQLLVAAVVAAAAVLVLRRSRIGRRPPRPEAQQNPDVNLDIGAEIAIEGWQDRRARTSYRGAQWDVELAPGEPEDARWYKVTALRGSCLIVSASRHTAHA